MSAGILAEGMKLRTDNCLHLENKLAIATKSGWHDGIHIACLPQEDEWAGELKRRLDMSI